MRATDEAQTKNQGSADEDVHLPSVTLAEGKSGLLTEEYPFPPAHSILGYLLLLDVGLDLRKWADCSSLCY